jgi:cytochrome b
LLINITPYFSILWRFFAYNNPAPPFALLGFGVAQNIMLLLTWGAAGGATSRSL